MDTRHQSEVGSVVTEAQLAQEFAKRAQAVGLKIDCLGSGRLDSEIVIIGQGPSTYETNMKMPMVGPSGRYLWDKLKKIGIDRNTCYVTNVVKRELTTGRKVDEKLPLPREELAHWEGLLAWELDQLPNVKYVLALGNVGLHALTHDVGITKWRGSVFDCKIGHSERIVKVMTTFNPAELLYENRWETIYQFDIAKFGMVLAGTFKKYEIKFHINPSFTEAMQTIEKLHDERLPVSFDIETIANETACVGFANSAYEGTCINFRNQTRNTFSLGEETALRKAIFNLLADRDTRLIAQNGNFDSYWLWYKDRIRVGPIWFDTLLAHHTLYPRFPHNLGFLTSQYTTHPFYKDEGKNWREGNNIDQFWEYNVKDACITWKCHQALLKELTAQKLDEFFFKHVMRLQPHLVAMTVGGVKIDRRWKDNVAFGDKAFEAIGLEPDRGLNGEVNDLRRKFERLAQELTGDSEYKPNPNAPGQVKTLFFEKLKLVGHGASTNKANRDRIRVHPRTTEKHIELLDTFDSYSNKRKFFSTYINSEIDPDGRCRCEYKQYGVQRAPGRLSSSGVLWGTGMNLQNQPHKAYPMFIADEGYMLSYFDLKQAEARCVAYGWNVPALIENFEMADQAPDKYDIHRLNAARIFKVPYDEIPKKDWTEDKQPTRRYLGKRCVHGLNYRMLAPKLAEVCNISVSLANEAWSSYHKAFPEIQKNGWDATIKEVRETKQLRTWFTPEGSVQARRFIVMEQITDELLEPIVAFRPQGTIGDKVSSVIYQCEEDSTWPTSARFLLNIHDALVALHKPEDKHVVQTLMKKHAEAPLKINGRLVSIPVDMKESHPDSEGFHRWSNLEELETPI